METRERRTAAGTGKRRRPAPRQQRRPSGRPARRSPAPSVVYTDPKPFNGRKMVLQLLTVAAVVLAVLFGLSIFFKADLDKATVAGNEKYTVNEIIEASGIRDGSNLLTLSDAQISGNIRAKLPYVNRVRIGIKLPDTVHIEISELSVPYAVEAEDGSWWLMSAEGRVVESVTRSEAKTYTKVLGMQIVKPEVGSTAEACEPEMPEITQPEPEDETVTPSETTIPQPSSDTPLQETKPSKPAIRGKDVMDGALNILQQLEKNGILGEAASIDVSDLASIELWYGRRYQVSLGNMDRMDYKIALLKSAVKQMGPHQSGQLDISFTTWPDQVGYTPFA